ncbi:hypothetical protein P7C71_g1181, partial [Lecanoromycetidae sp. Uapishka_2]
MFLEEGQLLEPRSASLQDPDQWPTFDLDTVTVFSQKTGEKTSLLSAHTVRVKEYQKSPIEISNVTMYAFAECEDGSFAFWAAGKSGWFAVQGPAISFKSTYNKMEEAASIFYMLADKRRRARKRSPKLTDNALSRYATQVFEDPSGGKFSNKAAARRGNLAATRDSDARQQGDEEDDFGEEPIETSPITTIRNAEDLELLTNPPTNRSPVATLSPEFLPRKYLQLKVVEYELPSTTPQGPGDLWTCTFEGCFHRVHEASTSTGKSRIKGHFKSHATQAQEKIDLALDESRPYLPVE